MLLETMHKYQWLRRCVIDKLQLEAEPVIINPVTAFGVIPNCMGRFFLM